MEAKDTRNAYAHEFREDPTLRAWASLPPPPKRTKRSSIASGKRVESGQSKIKQEAYRAVDIFTKYLWYHDKNRHVLYDNAHQFANVLKQMMNFINNRNKGNQLNFTPKIRKQELAQGTLTTDTTDTVRRTFACHCPYTVRRVVVNPHLFRTTMCDRPLLTVARPACHPPQISNATVGNRKRRHPVGGEHHPFPQDPVDMAPGQKVLHGGGLHEDVRGPPAGR